MRSLKDFAEYLIKNRLREVTLYNLNVLKNMDVPLIKLAQKKGLLKSLDDEETVTRSISGTERLLTSLKNGTGLEDAKTNLRNWEEDKIPGFKKDEILPTDLVLAYAAQKKGIHHFLSEFTDNSEESIAIIDELEDYYTYVQNEAIQLLFRIQTETKKQLHDQERQFRLMVQNAKDYAFFMIDTQGVIKTWNEGAKNIKGYSADEIIGKNISTFYTEEDKANGIPARNIEIARKTGHYEGEGKRIKKDGSTFWANVTITAVYDEQGQLQGFSKLTKDASTLWQAQLELEKKAAELERSNKELEQFAYVASHDLQEPLRTISSYVQLLSSRYKDKLDNEANEFIDFAVEGSKRMKQLITSLLNYSRIDTGKPFTIIHTPDIIRNVEQDLSEPIEESGALITYNNLPDIYGDPILIRQLFQNLIANAIKFRSDKRPEIKISGKRENGHYLFSVADNGIGINQEYSERIFVIFQRLNTREEYPGTGIGLSICKKIVERHGGKIWVQSQLGLGSTFYFTLKANN